eukprot:PITA_20509
MDDFTVYGDDFSQALANLEKVLICCQEADIALSSDKLVEFLFEDIFTRFGVPREIVKDQGTQLTSKLVKALTEQYGIKHYKLTPCHPQSNGKVESTNKVLKSILTKTIQLHHMDWVDKLLEALWNYRITWRNVTGHTPYELVYGKQVLLPIEFQETTFNTTTQLGMNLNEAQEKRLMQLNEFDKI